MSHNTYFNNFIPIHYSNDQALALYIFMMLNWYIQMYKLISEGCHLYHFVKQSYCIQFEAPDLRSVSIR